tara:strand:+ start:1590 stop:2000 length:411 start_codon:yes stop_codon:yes gene_type:complete
MSETNTQRKTMSAYQQLSGIINALKSEEISLNDALNKIQLKEQRPSRPYCKVTGSGALALYGISKQPMVMYADQWFKFLKVAKSDYIDNYIKYNESRLKFKKKMVKKNDNNDAVEEQLEQVEQVEQLENSETIQES